MANRHASPISRRKLEANRAAKMPSNEIMQRAAGMFPSEPFRAAALALKVRYFVSSKLTIDEAFTLAVREM